MDQKINNTSAQDVSETLQRICNTSNYNEVETIIADLVGPDEESISNRQLFLKALEAKIENLSPLPFTSTQWSCLRYALICLRSISK